MQQIVIHTPFIKLDAFLKFCGATETGGYAKEIILAGLVKVNGQQCFQRGKKLYPGNQVSLENKEYEVIAGED